MEAERAKNVCVVLVFENYLKAVFQFSCPTPWVGKEVKSHGLGFLYSGGSIKTAYKAYKTNV